MDRGGETAVRQGSIWREIALLAGAGAAVLLLAMVMATTDASAAETKTFGGNPAGELTPGIDCESYIAPFEGRETCLWEWAGPTAGDGVPFPETTGGSGTVTAVTLPPMPNPGPMEAVVLTGTLTGGSEPGYTNSVCCKITEISPQFTVPANQETTVPLDLAVSSTATGDIEGGEAPSYDGVGIAVLGPQYSIPLHYTGRTLVGEPGGADRDILYGPAPTTTSNGEYVKPADPTGYELMAKFTLETGVTAPAPAPAPTPAPAPAPAPAPPDGGLKLGGDTLTAANLAGPLTIGQAENPPTATTTQTLTVPGATAAAASRKKKPKAKPKPIVIGKGATTVPAGQTVALKLTLTSAGRKLLAKKHSLKVTETIVAKNSAGQTQTTTRTVTIRLKRK
jgi:hypothetical protein